MGTVRPLLVIAVVAAALAQAAAAGTPVPARASGSGKEPTTGGGFMLGQRFAAHYAVAQLDISFDQIQVYIFPKRVACNDVPFADPPFIAVTVDSDGAPLRVGKPAVANGQAFVQVDFHPAKSSQYYAIQPGVSLTFTRVAPMPHGVWHGRLTVKRQKSEGHVFSYRGTFAAHWCGRD